MPAPERKVRHERLLKWVDKHTAAVCIFYLPFILQHFQQQFYQYYFANYYLMSYHKCKINHVNMITQRHVIIIYLYAFFYVCLVLGPIVRSRAR